MSAVEILDLVMRILFGLNFFVFGVNGFFGFLPIPQSEPRMQDFTEALMRTRYLMTVIKILEILIGACLVVNLFVPLALAVAAPLVFGIVSSHLFLNQRRGKGISASVLIPFAILIFTRREAFAPLFSLR